MFQYSLQRQQRRCEAGSDAILTGFRITIKYLVERIVLQCHVLVPNVAIRALSSVILHIAVVADRRITMQM
jgi:hypothetical protein